MASHPNVFPRSKGLIAGLIKGNQWFISPKNKAIFLGRIQVLEGGRLTSQNLGGVNTFEKYDTSR